VVERRKSVVFSFSGEFGRRRRLLLIPPPFLPSFSSFSPLFLVV
jgi:hypothetical protein